MLTLLHKVIWKECGYDRYIDFYTCIEKLAGNFQPSCKVVHTGEQFIASICISGYDGSNEQECFMCLPWLHVRSGWKILVESKKWS